MLVTGKRTPRKREEARSRTTDTTVYRRTMQVRHFLGRLVLGPLDGLLGAKNFMVRVAQAPA